MTFIETLEKALGKTAEKEYLPMQPGDVYQTYADVSELERISDSGPAHPLQRDWGNSHAGTGSIIILSEE